MKVQDFDKKEFNYGKKVLLIKKRENLLGKMKKDKEIIKIACKEEVNNQVKVWLLFFL